MRKPLGQKGLSTSNPNTGFSCSVWGINFSLKPSFPPLWSLNTQLWFITKDSCVALLSPELLCSQRLALLRKQSGNHGGGLHPKLVCPREDRVFAMSCVGHRQPFQAKIC